MGERVLPTARELAEVHRQHELQNLRFLAMQVDDQQALALIDGAMRERMRIDLDEGLALPALKRAQDEEFKRQIEAHRAGYIGPEAYARLGGGLAVAQSVAQRG